MTNPTVIPVRLLTMAKRKVNDLIEKTFKKETNSAEISEYEVKLQNYVKKVVYGGIREAIVTYHKFCVLREEVIIHNLEKNGKIEPVTIEQALPGIELNNDEKLLIKRFEEAEQLLLFFPIEYLSPNNINQFVDSEHWCVFLICCLVYCEYHKIYSEIRRDIRNLFLEKLAIMQQISKKPISFLNKIVRIKDDIKVLDQEKLYRFYDKHPKVVNSLPEYIEKIKEIYCPLEIIVRVDYDPDYLEDDLMIEVKTQLSIDEVSQKDDILSKWNSQRRQESKEIIVVFAEAKD